ncbi:glycoside hydrolase family 108 protein [Aureimonas leprariae]|uniref:Lysozyme family protein n=1 Tax=Plantimonas leprariae TaxID=2615207 RepID=A0A7V7U1J5_9HYPH|nr:hypothetical protein F6X38_04160 [Aureimonas leprariae]
MERNFERSLSLVLAHEGGFSDHPADNGGATNKGVTIATFRAYVKPDGTVDDLKKLTTAQAGTVYRREYWDRVAGAQLPDGLDYAVFDFAVNSGPSRAAKYLQAIVGTPADGAIGPATLAAVAQHDATKLVEALCDARMRFLKSLGDWPTFGKGWTKRVADVRDEAHIMLVQPVVPPAVEPAPPALSGEILPPLPIARPDLAGRPVEIAEKILKEEGSRTIQKSDALIAKTIWSRVLQVAQGGGLLGLLPFAQSLPPWLYAFALGLVFIAVVLFWLDWRKAHDAKAIKIARVDDAVTGNVATGGLARAVGQGAS